jgi:hypothetical protein
LGHHISIDNDLIKEVKNKKGLIFATVPKPNTNYYRSRVVQCRRTVVLYRIVTAALLEETLNLFHRLQDYLPCICRVDSSCFNKGSNSNQIWTEHYRLQEHVNACTCGSIAKPMSSSIMFTSQLSGFTLGPVGYTCTREMIFEKKELTLGSVLMALFKLHRHSPNPIIHGDPRLPNLIVAGEKTLTWIDLMQCPSLESIAITPDLIANDMRILVMSLFPSLRTSDGHNLPTPLNQLIDLYSNQLHEESFRALEAYLNQL